MRYNTHVPNDTRLYLCPTYMCRQHLSTCKQFLTINNEKRWSLALKFGKFPESLFTLGTVTMRAQ